MSVEARPMVRLSGVCHSYGTFEAVKDLDLQLEEGEILALLGPSGCGKTTTLRLIAGFTPPSSGEIEIGGNTVAGRSSFVPPEKRRVGMVFQDYALFPHLSVEKNVAYGLPSGKKRKGRIEEVLSLARLEGLGDRMPHELSGGQQQRVALARAIAPEPDVVLLDEPFSNLDAALRAQVRREMREILTTAGATAIFVTHDQEEALSIADRVAVMLDGTVVQSATPRELYLRPATRQVAAFVGDANFVPGVADSGSVRTALGEIPVAGSHTGDVEVMVRPESLRVTPDPAGCGRVVSREFYGHDQLATIRLDGGHEVNARFFGTHVPVVRGDRVSVSVEGECVAFPAGEYRSG